jgi:hypothetical protein
VGAVVEESAPLKVFEDCHEMYFVWKEGLGIGWKFGLIETEPLFDLKNSSHFLIPIFPDTSQGTR